MHDNRATSAHYRLDESLDVQRHQGTQIEHGSGDPQFLELSGSSETVVDRSTPCDQGDVGASTHEATTPEGQHVRAVAGYRTSDGAIETLRLHEEHRIRIPDRDAEQVPRIIRERRAHDLDTRRLREQRLHRVWVEFRRAGPPSRRSANGHRHVKPPAGAGTIARELWPNLVERLKREPQELDLWYRNHPPDR